MRPRHSKWVSVALQNIPVGILHVRNGNHREAFVSTSFRHGVVGATDFHNPAPTSGRPGRGLRRLSAVFLARISQNPWRQGEYSCTRDACVRRVFPSARP